MHIGRSVLCMSCDLLCFLLNMLHFNKTKDHLLCLCQGTASLTFPLFWGRSGLSGKHDATTTGYVLSESGDRLQLLLFSSEIFSFFFCGGTPWQNVTSRNAAPGVSHDIKDDLKNKQTGDIFASHTSAPS